MAKLSNFEGDWDADCEFCGKTHRNHIWEENPVPNYLHRLPCEEEKEAIAKETKRQVRILNAFSFVWWILIPVAIIILGFANPIFSVILFGISLAKVGVTVIKFFGDPDKWFPGYTARKEKERLMNHYFYHCQKNPDGFQRLKDENFERED